MTSLSNVIESTIWEFHSLNKLENLRDKSMKNKIDTLTHILIEKLTGEKIHVQPDHMLPYITVNKIGRNYCLEIVMFEEGIFEVVPISNGTYKYVYLKYSHGFYEDYLCLGCLGTINKNYKDVIDMSSFLILALMATHIEEGLKHLFKKYNLEKIHRLVLAFYSKGLKRITSTRKTFEEIFGANPESIVDKYKIDVEDVLNSIIKGKGNVSATEPYCTYIVMHFKDYIDTGLISSIVHYSFENIFNININVYNIAKKIS